MANHRTSSVLDQLRRTLRARDGADLPDGLLLERFIAERDESAFAALLERHGAMVLGACRRMLPHHDAEDAFQVTFMILARKARTIVPREMVGNWLYGVAHQTALKARAMANKRRGREKQMAHFPEAAVDQAAAVVPGDAAILDEELRHLPDKYRLPIILCDLEDQTRKDVARRLGWPEGTVSGRLSRGRALLAKRLARRGLLLGAGSLATCLGQAEARIPTQLLAATLAAARDVANGASVTMLAPRTLALLEGVLRTMFIAKLKAKAGLCLLACVLLAMAGGVGRQVLAGDQPAPPRTEQQLRDTLLVLDQQFWDASAKHDVATLDRLIANDYVCFGSDGVQWTKDIFLEHSKNVRTTDFKLATEREVVRLSHDTAVLTYQVQFAAVDRQGKSYDAAHQRIVSCWVQRDGGWFMRFSQFVDVPPLTKSPETLKREFKGWTELQRKTRVPTEVWWTEVWRKDGKVDLQKERAKLWTETWLKEQKKKPQE